VRLLQPRSPTVSSAQSLTEDRHFFCSVVRFERSASARLICELRHRRSCGNYAINIGAWLGAAGGAPRSE